MGFNPTDAYLNSEDEDIDSIGGILNDLDDNSEDIMQATELVLNPRSDIIGSLKCSICDEEIVEVSTEHENRFECGCNHLIKFEIPTEQ